MCGIHFGSNYSKMKILVLKFLRRSNFEAFSRFGTLKTEERNLRVGYAYIEKSFDTILNIGGKNCRAGRTAPGPAHALWGENFTYFSYI